MLEQLSRALATRGEISQWVVREQRTTIDTRGTLTSRRSLEHQASATVYHDGPAGRGSAQIALSPHQLPALHALVTEAAQRAATATGPSWRLPLPAAPARVDLADEQLRNGGAESVLAALHDAVRAAQLTAVELYVCIHNSTVQLRTSTSFNSSYDSTLAEVKLIAEPQSGGPPVQFHQASRRFDDLRLTERLLRTARHAAESPAAKLLPPGRYTVALPASTLAATRCAEHPFGLFQPLATQADGNRSRRGLARYPAGALVHPGEPTGDPITLHSDGTLPFGLLSAPFGTWGEPVRRFPVVTDNRAAGVALGPREAALQATLPNGGMRNLQLAAGTQTTAPQHSLELAELAWFETDPATGSFTAAPRHAYLDGVPVRAHQVRGNLFAALAGATMSTETTFEGWYQGPRYLYLPGIAIDE